MISKKKSWLSKAVTLGLITGMATMGANSIAFAGEGDGPIIAERTKVVGITTDVTTSIIHAYGSLASDGSSAAVGAVTDIIGGVININANEGKYMDPEGVAIPDPSHIEATATTGAAILAYSKTADAKGPIITLAADEVVAFSETSVGIQATVASTAKNNPVITAANAPTVSINAKTITAIGYQGGVSAQDGVVNLGKKENYADVIHMESTFTTDLKAATYDDLYSALYVRSYGTAGETGVINAHGHNIYVMTPKNPFTNAENASANDGMYGTAIAGNGYGLVNLNSDHYMVIHGNIEGQNELLNPDGTSGLHILVNQDVETPATLNFVGDYITAADAAVVKIAGGENSNVEVNKIAASSSKVEGGLVEITLSGENSKIQNKTITAQYGGEVDVEAANIKTQQIQALGSQATDAGSSAVGAKTTVKGGKVNISVTDKLFATGESDAILAKSTYADQEAPQIYIEGGDVYAESSKGTGIWATVAKTARNNSAITAENAPTVTINAENITAIGADCAVVSQDGIINLGSRDNYATNVQLSSTYTSDSASDDYTDLWSTIFVRSYGTAGETGVVNVYGENVYVLSEANAFTNEANDNYADNKHGSAIAGNGFGTVNLNASNKMIIQGIIEGQNELLNPDGTSGLQILINQDIANAGQVDYTGAYISAADAAKILMTGGDNSTVDTYGIIASSSKVDGGTIGIALGENSTINSDVITAQYGGRVAVKASEINAETIGAYGSQKADAGSSAVGAKTAINGGTVIVEAGSLKVQDEDSSIVAISQYADATAPTVAIVADSVEATSTGGAAVWASVQKTASGNTAINKENAPRIAIIAENINLIGADCAVISQDALVNIVGDDIYLASTYTSNSATDRYTDMWSALYARGFTTQDETGIINVYGGRVTIDTPEQAFTNEENANYDKKYGNAIAGNGFGAIYVDATEELTIHGIIEGQNTYMNPNGSSDLKIHINQKNKEASKLNYEGAYIEAADNAEVLLSGGDGSTVITDYIKASSTSKAGGVIGINLAGESTFAGDILATKGGQVSVKAANIDSGTIGADNAHIAIDAGIANADTLNASDDGVILIRGGKITAETIKTSGFGAVKVTGGTLHADSYEAEENGIQISGAGALEALTGQVFDNGYVDVESNPTAKKEMFYFDDGTLVLSDEEISLAYLSNAKNIINVGENNTTIVTLATKFAEIELEDGKVSIDVIKDLELSDIVLGQITGTNDGDLDATGKNIAFKNLDLGDGKEVTIGDSGVVTLMGGAPGTDLVEGGDGDKTIAVEENGKLSLGVPGVDTEGIFAGTIRAQDGKVDVNGGSFTVGEINLAGASELNVTATANLNSLQADATSIVIVGNHDTAGTLRIKEAELKGGMLFLDPAWKAGVNLPQEASSVAIERFTNGDVDGNLAIGQNSILAIGTATADWAETAVNKSGVTWGPSGVGAALAIGTSGQVLSAGNSILVDGSLTSVPTLTPDKVVFKANSAFIVDVAGYTNADLALWAPTATTTVEPGSKLILDNAVAGNGYWVLDSASDPSIGGAANWTGNVLTTDRMIDASGAKVTADGYVDGLVVASDPGDYNIPTIMDEIWTNKLNDPNSLNPGISFLSKATNTLYIPNKADSERTINSATQIAAIGGMQASTLSAVKMFGGAVADRLNLMDEGDHLWAVYNHGKTKVRDLDAGNYKTGYDDKVNGITIGYDFKNDETGKYGVAFTYGEGKVTSVGDFDPTRNDYKYYGLDAYKVWRNDKVDVLADIGYIHNKGEIAQQTLLGELKADVKSNVLTAGVRGNFKTANEAITPYAGLRYVNLATKSFNTTDATGTVFETDKDTQNIWLLPVGVSYAREIKKGDNLFIPKVDIGALFTFGDKDISTVVRVPGIASSNTIGLSMADSVSFIGSAGFEYKTKKVNYGLSYQLQASSKEVRNGLLANIEFKF